MFVPSTRRRSWKILDGLKPVPRLWLDLMTSMSNKQTHHWNVKWEEEVAVKQKTHSIWHPSKENSCQEKIIKNIQVANLSKKHFFLPFVSVFSSDSPSCLLWDNHAWAEEDDEDVRQNRGAQVSVCFECEVLWMESPQTGRDLTWISAGSGASDRRRSSRWNASPSADPCWDPEPLESNATSQRRHSFKLASCVIKLIYRKKTDQVIFYELERFNSDVVFLSL